MQTKDHMHVYALWIVSFFFKSFFSEIKFLSVKQFTERPTTLMSTGNVGNDNFQKLNSSTFQNETENYNDKRLSINATSESNVASVQLSIIILICLGVIILGFYVASYKIKKNFVLNGLICERNTDNKSCFDKNGSCDI